MKTSPVNNERMATGGDKVTGYRWSLVDEPGTLSMLPKLSLSVDMSYQRDANEAKVLSIASAWSWIACGVIRVALRSDGSYAVIDGQHRVLAAAKRSDIQHLPCIVFRTTSLKQEAAGFLGSNTLRKPLRSIDKFRALLTVNDPAARLVLDLVEGVGRMIGTNEHDVRCVTALLAVARADEQILRRVWPILHEMSGEMSVHANLLRTLADIEARMPEGESLSAPRWRDRLQRLGAATLIDSMHKAAGYYGKTGERVWREGALNAINKGLRSPLVLRDDKEAR